MPNGKIYIIYARFNEVSFNDSNLEFVLAVHKDFKFDLYNNIIISKVQDDSTPVSTESLDQPDLKIKIVKTYRNLNSFDEAYEKLNKRAKKMLLKKEDEIEIGFQSVKNQHKSN